MEEVLVADTYARRRAERSLGPPGQMNSRSGSRLPRAQWVIYGLLLTSASG